MLLIPIIKLIFTLNYTNYKNESTQILITEQYLQKVIPYLNSMLNNIKISTEGKFQLTNKL